MLPSELGVPLLHLFAMVEGLRGHRTAFCLRLEGFLSLWRGFSEGQTDWIIAERSQQQWERPGQCNLMKPEDLEYSIAVHKFMEDCRPLKVWSIWSWHLPFDLKLSACNTLFKLKVQGQTQGNPCPYMHLSHIMGLGSQFMRNIPDFPFSYQTILVEI